MDGIAPKHIYVVYLNTDKVDKYSPILLDKLDGMLNSTLAYNEDERDKYAVYAIAASKSQLDEFFLFHKREAFEVKRLSRMKTESFYRTLDSYDYSLLVLHEVTVYMRLSMYKGIRAVTVPVMMTGHEEEELTLCYDNADTLLYDIYSRIKSFREIYTFADKELKGALKFTGMKRFIDEVEELYNNTAPSCSIVMDEWQGIRNTYSEVLIGGETDEILYF